MRTRILLVAGAFALGGGAAVPAGAVVFATYNQAGTTSTISYAAGALTAGSQVQFGFTQPSLVAAGLTDLLANFTLSLATTTAPVSAAGFIIQPGFSGNFSFTYAGAAPLTVGGRTYTTGATLLRGTLTGGGGAVSGAAGSTSGGFSASEATSGTGITYTSDILTFGGGTDDIAVGLSSIVPGLVLTGGALGAFTASSTGSFGASILPTTPIVPEPATWGLMLLGFGLVGVASRRRRVRQVLA